MTNTFLSADEVRSAVDYDPETGVMTWRYIHSRNSKANIRRIGTPVGTKCKKTNRIVVRLYGRIYKVHRLAWIWMTGEWPEDFIDHINRDPSDNSWSNLRIASNSENQSNRTAPSDNKSGHKGVHWHKNTSKWIVQIQRDGKQITVGRFDDVDAAGAAYQSAARTLFGQFACDPQ